MRYTPILLFVILSLGFLLRFFNVSTNPPGLYIDEVSIGNNAYSILTTGKDEHGIAHPLWFKAFGEYKMPAYIYATSASMALFGKTEFAIRFPSIVAGTLTILVLYLFLSKLIHQETNTHLRKKLRYLPLLAASLLAISTWHIHFSRGGFEITLATFFYILGLYFFVYFKTKKQLWILLFCIISLLLAMYTYNIFRILTPVTLLSIAHVQQLYKHPRFIYFILITLLLSLPMMLFSFTGEGSQRFAATSAFSQFRIQGILQQFLTYPLIYLNNYLSFFSFDFLFSTGDGIGRHQLPFFGELFRWQLLFFLGGMYILIKYRQSVLAHITFFLFLTTPFAAALADPSPHALRAFPLVIPCVILVAVGLLFFIQSFSRYKKSAICFIIILVACYEFLFYLHFYYVQYPRINQLDWGSGYKELVLAASQEKYKDKHIVIDDSLRFAPTYVYFYNPMIQFTMVPPTWVKPQSWKDDSFIYIRPYYAKKQGKHIIEDVYLINNNNDEIFAQFWNKLL